MARAFAERQDEFARLATRESGLCLKDTRYEINRVIDALDLAADVTSFDDSHVFAGDVGHNGGAAHHQPP